MLRRVPLLITLWFAALLGAGVAPAGAAPIVFGSTLEATPNLSFGCNWRPYPAANGATLIPTNQTTCMWFQAGVSQASTYVPRGQGTVVGARVKVGNTPAPLRISIVSSGGGLCCTQQGRSEVFQPAPNSITTVPLNLPAGSGADPNRFGSQYNDIVTITGAGLGSLPVHDTGTHGNFSDLSAPAASFIHPELTNNNSSTDVGYMDGYEVLLQVLWCGTAGTGTTATGARAANPDELQAYRAQNIDCPAPTAATSTPGGGGAGDAGAAGGAGGTPTLKAARLSAPISKGRARVRLACANAACSGSVILRKRGTKVQLGKKTLFSAGAGAEAVVRVPLTANGKAAIKRKATVSADAVVTLNGVAKPLKLTVSLKR